MSETWLPIPGYEGLYDVSSNGQVKSIRSSKILQPGVHNQGYLQVALYKDGLHRTFKIHRLMALAFLGPRPDSMQVRHLDGDKTNLFVGNLRYGTAKENAGDRTRHGGDGHSKLTHCPQGHEYTAENTYLRPREGWRQCRICNRAHDAKHKAKLKAMVP